MSRPENFLRRSDLLHKGSIHTQDPVRYPRGKLQLMQRQDHCQSLFFLKLLQHGKKFQLIFYIQIRGRLIQQQDFRLLADRPGKQDTLSLSVADLRKIPIPEFQHMHGFHCFLHGFMILCGQNSEPPGIGVTPGCHHILTGHQLCMWPFCKDNRHLFCQLTSRKALQIFILQKDTASQKLQLTRNAF